MNRLSSSVLPIGSLLVVAACAPSTSPDKGVAPPLVADTVLYVGARVPVYSLMSTSSGGPYTPAPTTHVRTITQSNSIDLTGDIISAPYVPGAVVVQVSDDVGKWVKTFRIGAVWDLRRTWQFSAMCATAQVSTDDVTSTLSSFVPTQTAVLVANPQWGADNKPSVGVSITGVWTDSVFHLYRHSDNHIRPDTAVFLRGVVVNTLQSDSSMSIRYTRADGASAILAGGPNQWENANASFSGAGVTVPCRANLNARS